MESPLSNAVTWYPHRLTFRPARLLTFNQDHEIQATYSDEPP